MKAALHNLGCKVNDYETQAMEGLLKKAGYDIVDFNELADIYVVNTCSVTTIADRKSRQMLHKARKKNPHSIVIACGCYVQQAGDLLLEDGSVDIIIGNNEKHNIIEMIDSFKISGANRLMKEDLLHEKEFEEIKLEKPGDHVRAYIKIQDGCNRFCSYCIIPYMRGGIRSRGKEEIKEEIKGLVQAGYKEVVLTGIHISSYGIDLGEKNSLIELIEDLHKIPGLLRIRLGSLEPRIITHEFVDRLGKLDKVCPHFHLSLQSGCDSVLKRMNRRYTIAEYKESVDLLRKIFENPAITTDIIVGFPGESQDEFDMTRQSVEEINFFETHIFKFSGRPGTKAYDMPDQIDGNIKQERSNILLSIHEKNQKKYLESFVGKKVSVLLEEDKIEYKKGLTPNYMSVHLQTKEPINEVLTVEIKRVEGSYLIGQVLGG